MTKLFLHALRNVPMEMLNMFSGGDYRTHPSLECDFTGTQLNKLLLVIRWICHTL